MMKDYSAESYKDALKKMNLFESLLFYVSMDTTYSKVIQRLI